MDSITLTDARKMLSQAQQIANAAAQLQNMCSAFVFTNNIRGFFKGGANEIKDAMFSAPKTEVIDGKATTTPAGELYDTDHYPVATRSDGVKVKTVSEIESIVKFCADVAPIAEEYAPIFEKIRNDR